MAPRDADAPPAPAPLAAPALLSTPGTPGTAGDRIGWRGVGAALGLALAGVSAPIAVTATAATSGLFGPPLVASVLVALLVLAPAGVGLATALSGLRRVAASLAAPGAAEAEQAVLRVLVGTIIFGYSLGLAAVTTNSDQMGPHLPALYLLVAAFGLVSAWALLLHVILFPAARPVRRSGAMALDLALFSAFLHFGGDAVAGWYLLYPLAICYAGFRFGRRTLLGTAIGSILGFASVVLSTDVWRQLPTLSAGLILALALLPLLIAGAIRAIASALAATAQAEAARRGILLLIADNLRGTRARMGAIARGADEPELAARRDRDLATRIDDVADFAALEAGTFAAPFEAFDLRLLVKDSLVPLQAGAAEKGVALRWRVDPHLPFRLRGRARAFARILGSLAGHMVEAAPTGMVRIALDAVGGDGSRLRLRLLMENAGDDRAPGLAHGLAPGGDALALTLVRRLVALMGGEFAIDRTPGQQTPGQRTRLAVTLALAIEEGAAGPIPDLGNRAVLIATEDEEFAGELSELLYQWNADAHWVGDADAALAELSRRDAPERPVVVLIVDGRGKMLSALSLAHHAARIGGAAPFVLLVADSSQFESLGEVDEGEIDGFIPTPVSEALLANALHALPLGPLGPLGPNRLAIRPLAEPPRPPPEKRGETGEPAEHASARAGERAGAQTGERITPIASHPKFLPDTAATLDMRAIEGLRALGGGPGFLGEVIDTFRTDARQIMHRIDEAVASANAAGFAQSLVALRRAASPLGGAQLGELLASLQGLTASELRQQGAVHVQRLDAEIDRLAAALIELVPAAEARLP